jgi:hypothetical protein
MLYYKAIVVISFSSSPPYKAEAALAASAFSFPEKSILLR